MKIAFIGNSHLAAIKLGWDRISEDHNAVATFYASGGTLLRRFEINDRTLSPSDDRVKAMFLRSAGRDHIVAEYDHYVLVGFGSSVNRPMERLKTHKLRPMYKKNDTAQLISDSCHRDLIYDELRGSVALRLFHAIRKLTAAPVTLLPDPYISHSVIENSDYAHWHHREVREKVLKVYMTAVDEILRPHMATHFQPERTIYDGIFTRAEYSRGAVRLGSTDFNIPLNDVRHMNGDFGKEYLTDVLPSIFTTLHTQPSSSAGASNETPSPS